MVLGTCAYCGSGQDTLADGFCQYLGFSKYCMGDVIRDIARKRNLPVRREILQNIRLELNLIYGKNYVPECIVRRINESGFPPGKIIITGIRTVEEYSILREKLDMKLLFVYADEDIRYQRMLKRRDEKDEESFLELRKRMERENELFDYLQLKAFALYRFNFNMPLDKYKGDEKNIVQEVFLQMMKRE